MNTTDSTTSPPRVKTFSATPSLLRLMIEADPDRANQADSAINNRIGRGLACRGLIHYDKKEAVSEFPLPYIAKKGEDYVF